jgi:parallel beta-helix repeat protein
VLIASNILAVANVSNSITCMSSNDSGYYTYYVDDDNVDGPWDGSKEWPYRTIQDAIDNTFYDDGDTVYVYNGTYKECVVLYKTIHLVGESKDSTIIDGQRKGNTIWVGRPHSTISGFKVINCIDDAFSAGIHVRKNDVQISDCDIEGNDCGIRTHHINDVSIDNCTIHDNNGCSVYVITSSNITISNCEIYQNGDPVGYPGGIVVDNSNEYDTQSNIIVQNCDIYDNIIDGISVGNGGWGGLGYTDVLIENNHIFNNTNRGILIWESQVTIKNNNISKNGRGDSYYGGIMLSDTHGLVTIENNSIMDNNRNGIYFLRSTDNIIKNNNFIGNKRQIRFSYTEITSKNIFIDNYYDNMKNPWIKIFFGLYDPPDKKIILPLIIVDWHPTKEPFEFQ